MLQWALEKRREICQKKIRWRVASLGILCIVVYDAIVISLSKTSWSIWVAGTIRRLPPQRLTMCWMQRMYPGRRAPMYLEWDPPIPMSRNMTVLMLFESTFSGLHTTWSGTLDSYPSFSIFTYSLRCHSVTLFMRLKRCLINSDLLFEVLYLQFKDRSFFLFRLW